MCFIESQKLSLRIRRIGFVLFWSGLRVSKLKQSKRLFWRSEVAKATSIGSEALLSRPRRLCDATGLEPDVPEEHWRVRGPFSAPKNFIINKNQKHPSYDECFSWSGLRVSKLKQSKRLFWRSEVAKATSIGSEAMLSRPRRLCDATGLEPDAPQGALAGKTPLFRSKKSKAPILR